MGLSCLFAWKNDFLGNLTSTNIVYLFSSIMLQCLKTVLRLDQIVRYKVLHFWTKLNTNHLSTNREDFIEKWKHQTWKNEASIVKYVRYTWKLCVKSTIKAPGQWELCSSGVLIFELRGIFTTQLNIYDKTLKIVNSQKLEYWIGL